MVEIKYVSTPMGGSDYVRYHGRKVDGTLMDRFWDINPSSVIQTTHLAFTYTENADLGQGMHTIDYTNSGYVEITPWFTQIYVDGALIGQGDVGREKHLTLQFEVERPTYPTESHTIIFTVYSPGGDTVEPNARVVVMDQWEQQTIADAFTDGYGVCSITLPTGDYMVHAEKQGYMNSYSSYQNFATDMVYAIYLTSGTTPTPSPPPAQPTPNVPFNLISIAGMLGTGVAFTWLAKKM